MAATVKVVAQAEGEAIAEVALDGQVRLLRVGVNEVLSLRVTERLGEQRKAGVDVVLIEKQCVRQEGIEALRVGGAVGGCLLITEKACKCWRPGRALRGGREVALEHRDRVQVARTAGGRTRKSAGECQLAAVGAVGSIAEEVETEQGVVIEHAERRADYGFAVSLGIPGDAEARLNVVLVGLDAFL